MDCIFYDLVEGHGLDLTGMRPDFPQETAQQLRRLSGFYGDGEGAPSLRLGKLGQWHVLTAAVSAGEGRCHRRLAHFLLDGSEMDHLGTLDWREVYREAVEFARAMDQGRTLRPIRTREDAGWQPQEAVREGLMAAAAFPDSGKKVRFVSPEAGEAPLAWLNWLFDQLTPAMRRELSFHVHAASAAECSGVKLAFTGAAMERSGGEIADVTILDVQDPERSFYNYALSPAFAAARKYLASSELHRARARELVQETGGLKELSELAALNWSDPAQALQKALEWADREKLTAALGRIYQPQELVGLLRAVPEWLRREPGLLSGIRQLCGEAAQPADAGFEQLMADREEDLFPPKTSIGPFTWQQWLLLGTEAAIPVIVLWLSFGPPVGKGSVLLAAALGGVWARLLPKARELLGK